MVFLSLVIFITVAAKKRVFSAPLALYRGFSVWNILFSQYFANITIDTNIRNGECEKVEALSQNLLWVTGECFRWLTHGLKVFLSFVIFITVATKKGLQCYGKKLSFSICRGVLKRLLSAALRWSISRGGWFWMWVKISRNLIDASLKCQMACQIWEAQIHEASNQSIWTSSLTAVCQRFEIVSVFITH